MSPNKFQNLLVSCLRSTVGGGVLLRGGAEKSLARPGRKQATANKLRIYSIYSPQSSTQFLARCSNFCKALKKNSEGFPSNQVSATAMTSASDEKLRPFNCFSSPKWREFPSAPCLAGGKKNLDDSSRLDVVGIARVARHASFQPLLTRKDLQFGT